MTNRRTTFRMRGRHSTTGYEPEGSTLPHSGPITWDWPSGLAYVRRRRALVAGFVGAVIVLAAIYNWISPDVYTATATLLPPRSAGKLSRFTTLQPGLLSIAGAAIPADLSTGSELYPTVLHSESVIRPLLATPFPTASPSDHDSVTLAQIVEAVDPQIGTERVRKLVKIKVSRPTGTCRVSVTLEDPVTAAALCNAFVDALADRGIALHTTGAARLRRFIAGRLEEVKGELLQAEQKLEQFRTQNRNFGYASSPDLQVADARLARQVTLKSQLYLQLSQEYEMARIEEKRDVADVRVLDAAMIPTVKSGPHRIRSTLLAGVSAMPVAIMLLLLWHFALQMRGQEGPSGDADDINFLRQPEQPKTESLVESHRTGG